MRNALQGPGGPPGTAVVLRKRRNLSPAPAHCPRPKPVKTRDKRRPTKTEIRAALSARAAMLRALRILRYKLREVFPSEVKFEKDAQPESLGEFGKHLGDAVCRFMVDIAKVLAMGGLSPRLLDHIADTLRLVESIWIRCATGLSGGSALLDEGDFDPPNPGSGPRQTPEAKALLKSVSQALVAFDQELGKHMRALPPAF